MFTKFFRRRRSCLPAVKAYTIRYTDIHGIPAVLTMDGANADVVAADVVHSYGAVSIQSIIEGG